MTRAPYTYTLLAAACLALAMPLYASDDDHHRGRSTVDVQPASDTAYVEECGSCHWAYAPGLLPAASWRRVIDDLANHFGDNAELGAELERQLLDYLQANAADASQAPLSQRIVRSLGGAAPMRITDVGYIRHEHDELPAKVVRSNPQVQSLSRCPVCHTGAEQGRFDEDRIRIPGIGRWDD